MLQSAVSGGIGSAPVTVASGGRLNVTAVGGIGGSSVVAGPGSLIAFRTDGLSLAQMTTETAGVTWQPGSFLALDTSGGNFTLAEEFQPSLGLAKVGANTLTFAPATSVRTGAISVQQGGIRLGAAGALGSAVVTPPTTSSSRVTSPSATPSPPAASPCPATSLSGPPPARSPSPRP
ncbi:MAG: hypothetical protein EBX35_14900 [Planctomycetia bacterium]|nr:hypothetical protein [Planctomycetia bacterium]